MLVYAPFALGFVYTSSRFYAFSRTNLLTRCHSASSLFFAVFVFQKSYTGNILGIFSKKHTTSPEIFSKKHTTSRRRRRCEVGMVQKFFPAPCRRGESPPEAFFIIIPASGVMCE
jgi:hypothetical protein